MELVSLLRHQADIPQKQFGDDVVAVLDALHLLKPVLVGHSIAGEEMSSVSKHHPGRVSAMIYLDAGGPFALYNPEHGDIDLDRAELQQDLSKLGKTRMAMLSSRRRLLTRLAIGVTCKTCVMRSKARLHLHRLRLTCPASPHSKGTSLDTTEESSQRKKYDSTTRSRRTDQLGIGSHILAVPERRNLSTSVSAP